MGSAHSLESSVPSLRPVIAPHLPDEILLAILDFIPRNAESQSILHSFCLVSQQWYRIGISRLYDYPRLTGSAYSLFVRTICPSVMPSVQKSELAGLVRILDLGVIVHQGSKSMTARLLGRTKVNLEKFVAPQASFAVNCWAALSKCSQLRYLDLSLVSEAISYQALTQTTRNMPELTDLYLPRCSSTYDNMQISMNVKWPPNLERLRLSGGIHGKFMYDLIRQPYNFPDTLTHLSVAHSPKISELEIIQLLKNLGDRLLWVELRDLPQLREGALDSVLRCCQLLKELVISIDYIDLDFGSMPVGFKPDMWEQAHPLERLSIITSGNPHPDSDNYFTPSDLFAMVDTRWLGRLRYLSVRSATLWTYKDDWGLELDALKDALEEVDEESFKFKRWHYANGVGEAMAYTKWKFTMKGRKIVPHVRVIDDFGNLVLSL